jgi:hypothetical protein
MKITLKSVQRRQERTIGGDLITYHICMHENTTFIPLCTINIYLEWMYKWMSEWKLKFLLLLCWWGYIIAFTKILTTNHIYHTWIEPLYCSLSFPLPWFVEMTTANFVFIFLDKKIFCVIAMLGIELETYHMLRKHSNTELSPSLPGVH